VSPPNGAGRPPEGKRPATTDTSAATAWSDAVRIAPAYRVDSLPATVASRVVVHPVSGCWVWTGRTDRDGYGRLGRHGIHRVVYRLLVGEIPADRPILDHQAAAGCIFRRCCFPGHLRPSTARENTLAGRSFAAINAGKTRCDNGHPYDAANTYWRPNGHRDCRVCIRRRVAAYSSRKRASFARAA
jgi:hypothetical protein